MILGLIPARRGFGKNTRLLGGVPLVVWTLEAARQAQALDRIVLTTDDARAMQLGVGQHVEVLARPADLARDDTPDLPVVVHALTALGLTDPDPDDLVVLLRPTSPFRCPEEIGRVVDLLRDHSEVTSVRSVIRTRAHPQKVYREAGFTGLPYTVLLPYTPHHWANGPRQALDPVWQPVGFVDACRASWVFWDSLEGPVIAAWEAPEDRAVELDDEQDWQRAEALIREYGWKPGEVGE